MNQAVLDRPRIEETLEWRGVALVGTAPATLPQEAPVTEPPVPAPTEPLPAEEPPPTEEPGGPEVIPGPNPLDPDADPTPFQPFEPTPDDPDTSPAEIPAPEPGKTYPFCRSRDVFSSVKLPKIE